MSDVTVGKIKKYLPNSPMEHVIPHENLKHNRLESHNFFKKTQTTDSLKDSLYIVRLIANENSGHESKK